MKKLYELTDQQYPYTYIDHNRPIARAVVLNKDNKIALIHLIADDIFGHRDCYELPGGGVNSNESLEDAAIRELNEEVGVQASIICEIGLVEDDYNLIHRHNLNNYFLAKVITEGKQHLEEYEKKMFSEVVWVSLDEGIALMSGQSDHGVDALVKKRELPILKLAKELISTLQKQ